MAFKTPHAVRVGLGTFVLGLAALAAFTPTRDATAAHRVKMVPVAWVNGQPIQRTVLIELLNLRAADHAPTGRPLAPATQADRERALDDIIRLEVLTQKAQADGLVDTPQAQAELAWQRDTVLGQRLLRLMHQETTASDAEIAERHARLRTEHEVSARHILLRDEATAKAVIARLAAGVPFDELARRESIDSETRDKGGRLATGNASAFVPAFSEALMTMQPGQTSRAPVRTDAGWHVIALDTLRTVAPPTLSEARDWLGPEIIRDKVDAQVSAWRQAADVKVLQTLDDKPLADESGLVATVDGRPLSRVRLERQVKARNGVEDAKAPMPARLEGRAATLEEMVLADVLAQRARERQLDQNPSVEAEMSLQSKSAIARLYERHLVSTMRVTPAELKSGYDIEVPRTDFKVSHIVVAEAADAAEVIAALDKGGRFAELARAHSSDEATKATAGSLGWVMANEMPAELSAAVRKLKPGRHAARPIRSDQGWHVVRLDAVRPAAARPPLAQATEWLMPKLLHDKVEARVAQLRAQAEVRHAE